MHETTRRDTRALLAALGLATACLLMPARAAAQYSASTFAHSDVNASTSYSAMASDAKDASSAVGAAVAVETRSANSDNLWHTITAENWSRAGATVSGGALHLDAVSQADSVSTQVCVEACLGSANAVAHAFASASFADAATMNIAGLAAGTRVLATFRVDIDGGLAAHATGNLTGWQVATVNWSFFINGTRQEANGGYGYRIWVDGGSLRDNSAASMPGSVLLQTTLTLGQTFDLSMAASVSAQAVAGTSINGLPIGHTDESGGHATAGFANTFAWGGLTGLTDLSGQALDLSLARVTSASGFDYTQAYAAAVPEPGTTALLLAGLLVLAALRVRPPRR